VIEALGPEILDPRELLSYALKSGSSFLAIPTPGRDQQRSHHRTTRLYRRHVNTMPFTSYNYHGKGNFAPMVDAVVLGATEVDIRGTVKALETAQRSVSL
jgi:hypothetical protein